jgi:hypothetical protein
MEARHVATSLHNGARTGKGWGDIADHSAWQGRIFSLSDEYFDKVKERTPELKEFAENNLTNPAGSDIIEPQVDENAFDIAKSGGRNHGAYNLAMEMNENQLNRAIKKFEKNIAEHQHKIQNPSLYYNDWAEADEKVKAGRILHWKKELTTFAEQLFIFNQIRKGR